MDAAMMQQITGSVANAASAAGSIIGMTANSGKSEQKAYWKGKKTGYNDAIAQDQLDQQKRLSDLAQQYDIAALQRLSEKEREQFDYTQQGAKDMFDYTYKTVGDKVAELKAAGMNPGLIYGGSVAGGGGTTTGGQTGGDAGRQAPAQASKENERRMADIAAAELGLRQRRQFAEIRNIEADTQQKEATTSKTSTEEEIMIAKSPEEIKNLRTQNNVLEEQVKVMITQQDRNVAEVEQQWEKVQQNEIALMLKEAEINNKIKLTDEQIKQIANDITIKAKEVAVKEGQLELNTIQTLLEVDIKHFTKYGGSLAGSIVGAIDGNIRLLHNYIKSTPAAKEYFKSEENKK